MIKADSIYLCKVFENLLSNALKFSSPNKNIYISIEEEKNFYLAKFRDEGPGISKSDQEILFLRFKSLSAKPTGGEDSTGLGLVIVKKFCRINGRTNLL